MRAFPSVPKRRGSTAFWSVPLAMLLLSSLPAAGGRASAQDASGDQPESSGERRAQASRVRLADVATLGEALEAISRDSGIEFQHRADESQPVRPSAAALPAWHALDYALDQADLDVDFYGGDRGVLELVPRPPDRPARVASAEYAGIYRIEPTSVTARRVLNRPKLSGLNVALEVAWEPRLTPIGLTLPIDRLSGRLDDGASLVPQETGETIDVATNRDVSFSEFSLPMKLPAGNPRTIESLRGVLRAMLPGAEHEFKLRLRETGSQLTKDALTVQVEDIRANGPLYEVRLAVELQDAGRALESHRQWIFENDVYAVDDDGQRLEHLGFQVYRQTAGGVGVSYLFDLGASVNDWTVVYESPTSVVQDEVTFVLRDIPLP